MKTTFDVNGKPVELDVRPRMTLADCLRHEVGLTGTHVACEHGVCGACTVIIDGEAVRSCLTLAVQADGTAITTVEGLRDKDGGLLPLQLAFKKHHGLQCGFCTAGMLTPLHALLTGNICRCTGYISIIEAALEARASYQSQVRVG
jgi:aerobic carbon-monoxide dehydrogenase small subunit